MNNKMFVRTGLALLLSNLVGCASIVNGTNQIVTVETHLNGQPLVGANCSLINGKGTYYVTSPGTLTVNRAYDNLNVKCVKDGVAPGMASVKSSTKPMAFGNILFGGIIGAAVDAGSGAAYDYPALISVIMGETIDLGAPPPAAASASASSAPAAAAAPVAQK